MRSDIIAAALIGAVVVVVVVLYLYQLWRAVLIDDDAETDAWLADLHERDEPPSPRLPQ